MTACFSKADSIDYVVYIAPDRLQPDNFLSRINRLAILPLTCDQSNSVKILYSKMFLQMSSKPRNVPVF